MPGLQIPFQIVGGGSDDADRVIRTSKFEANSSMDLCVCDFVCV